MPNDKHKIKDAIGKVIVFLLILLWVYAAVSKLLDFGHYKNQINNQNLPRSLKFVSIYFLPFIELLIAGCLANRTTVYIAFWSSFTLLLLFSGYIFAVLLNVYSRVPCSCGGILQNMGWMTHLIFNVAFLILNLYLIITYQGKEAPGK